MATTHEPTQPRIAIYVRAVEGRLVPRCGSQGYYGARRLPTTREERLAGQPMLAWDTECVCPVTELHWNTYRREIAKALRNGDLREATAAEYRQWLGVQAKREEAHEARLKAAKRDAEAETRKAARAAAKSSEGQTAEVTE